MTIEDKRIESMNLIERIQTRANTARMYYVVCMWESPLTKDSLCHRVGYFEDVIEASNYRATLENTYKNLKFKFYIVSNAIETLDGGLFDEAEENNS